MCASRAQRRRCHARSTPAIGAAHRTRAPRAHQASDVALRDVDARAAAVARASRVCIASATDAASDARRVARRSAADEHDDNANDADNEPGRAVVADDDDDDNDNDDNDDGDDDDDESVDAASRATLHALRGELQRVGAQLARALAAQRRAAIDVADAGGDDVGADADNDDGERSRATTRDVLTAAARLGDLLRALELTRAQLGVSLW